MSRFYLHQDAHPEDFGLPMSSNRAFRVETPEQSVTLLRGVLAGQPGPARDVVLLNAGAALYAAGVAPGIAEGITRAREVIDSGAAQAKLDELAVFTRQLAA